MRKCCNNIYILMASLSMWTATADDNNMSGLYIGLGANVGYDEYDARAVSKAFDNIKTVTVTDTFVGKIFLNNEEYENEMKDGLNISINDTISLESNDADDLINKLWAINESKDYDGDDIYVKNELVVGDRNWNMFIYTNEIEDSEVVDIDINEPCPRLSTEQLVNLYIKGEISGEQILSDCLDDKSIYYANNGNFIEFAYDNCHIHGHMLKSIPMTLPLPDGELSSISLKINGEPTDFECSKYYPIRLYLNIPEELNGLELINSKVNVSTQLSSGASISQSLRRSGRNSGGEMKMAYFHDFGNHLMAGIDLTSAVSSKNRKEVPWYCQSDLILSGKNGLIATATYKDGKYHTTAVGGAKIVKDDVLVLSNDPNTSNDQNVSLEKGIFNPKLAFVVGGTYNGWFAGVRAGVSYNTGKIKTPDMKSIKNVSMVSPLVGVHVMKKVSDNTNLYMTADWNVGDIRKSVDLNGIKSFKQSSYSVSAGVQWRCNLIK